MAGVECPSKERVDGKVVVITQKEVRSCIKGMI
jgi:hypothetical protein